MSDVENSVELLNKSEHIKNDTKTQSRRYFRAKDII